MDLDEMLFRQRLLGMDYVNLSPREKVGYLHLKMAETTQILRQLRKEHKRQYWRALAPKEKHGIFAEELRCAVQRRGRKRKIMYQLSRLKKFGGSARGQVHNPKDHESDKGLGSTAERHHTELI